MTYDLPLPRPHRGPAALLALAAALASLAGAVAVWSLPRATQGEQTASGAVAPQSQSYAPRTLVVGYSGTAAALIAEIRHDTGLAVTVSSLPNATPDEQLLELPLRADVPTVATGVSTLPGVRYAVPDYIAHAAGSWYPNDTGRNGQAEGWEKVQWNFMPRAGVNAPLAWANLRADRRAGARGVTIAVIDTGIAFRDWGKFKRSPDFAGTHFVAPCDLVVGHIRKGRCTDPFALDREGHGTFVTGTIAESTDNRYSLTGLAYNASIMPVRVLDADGNGDSSTIAAGIRYAVQHGAKVINLSIEFNPGTTVRQIPDVFSAITYAHNRGVVMVGAAGNDEDSSIDYPAALSDVISVGATTADECLAVYSDIGKQLDLVAPGGGDDAAEVPGSVCHPQRILPDIYQMTIVSAVKPGGFGLPTGWFGTSMAAPAVSAAAAMVIASDVLGRHPTPTQILKRLEATARPLGSGTPNNDYGYGLIDIGTATTRGGPLTPTTKKPPYSLKGASGSTTTVRLRSRSPRSQTRRSAPAYRSKALASIGPER